MYSISNDFKEIIRFPEISNNMYSIKYFNKTKNGDIIHYAVFGAGVIPDRW